MLSVDLSFNARLNFRSKSHVSRRLTEVEEEQLLKKKMRDQDVYMFAKHRVRWLIMTAVVVYTNDKFN